MEIDDNIIGKNIKYMRTMHGETLEELGYAIYSSKNTVQGYESGRRKPDINTVEKIARYYGKTVDEMIHNKLFELEKISSDKVIKMDEMIDVSLHVLPIIETEEACKNKSFLEGVTEIKSMINSLRSGMEVEGMIIPQIGDCFIKAVEDNVIEAVANMIWCIFFIWSQQYTDFERLRKLQTRINNGEVDWKELTYEYQKDAKKSFSKKKSFICDFDKLLIELIRELKTNEEWSQLGDYYLALRYVLGMVDTEYSDAMNQVIGMQMLMAFAQIGNVYALDFLKTCSDI